MCELQLLKLPTVTQTLTIPIEVMALYSSIELFHAFNRSKHHLCLISIA